MVPFLLLKIFPVARVSIILSLIREGNLWIGSHPNLLRFSAYAKGKQSTSPSEIIKIIYRELGDYSIEKIYVEDGHEMSGSTVAATFGNLILAGNVMDDEFLDFRKKYSQYF